MNEEMRATIIRDWGLQEFPPEQQDEYVEQIGQILYQNIVLRATSEMDDAAQEALDAFMTAQGDTVDTAKALDYLKEHCPTFNEIVQEESETLRARMAPPALE